MFHNCCLSWTAFFVAGDCIKIITNSFFSIVGQESVLSAWRQIKSEQLAEERVLHVPLVHGVKSKVNN